MPRTLVLFYGNPLSSRRWSAVAVPPCDLDCRGGRDRLHVMRTSTGYEIATGPCYDWDGAQTWSTPFSAASTHRRVGPLK